MIETLSRPLAKRIVGLALAAPEAAEPDIPAHVVRAASEALDRGETHYADRPGIPELRALVANRLNARFGLGYQPNDVTITCGSTEARYCALQLFVKSGAPVVCPGDSRRIDATVLLGGLTLLKTDDAQAGSVLYLTPADDVAVWLDLAEANDWWVIWDTSGQPAGAVHPAQRPALVARVISIDDLESQMPGWRVGWMVGSEKHTQLRAFKQAMTICTTNVSQWAALELLRSEDA
jgi:aspartate aminotransferase